MTLQNYWWQGYSCIFYVKNKLILTIFLRKSENQLQMITPGNIKDQQTTVKKLFLQTFQGVESSNRI